MAVQDMDIPYPSQHTMSSNHLPASEMPFKCFRCRIAKKEKKEEKKAGEGMCVSVAVGNRLESPRQNPFNFCGVFLHVLLLFLYGLRGGGVNC